MPGVVSKVLAWPMIALLRFYQLVISPWLGGNCRYQPTCSQYAIEALRQRGVRKGCLLALRRIGRCHPWGASGYDPVPEKPLPKESAPKPNGDQRDAE